MIALPDEVRAEMEAESDYGDRLNRLGVVIARKRDEAVSARRNSGIEDIWQECEEAYLGIDEENRHEFAGAKWAKPTSMDGPVTTTRRTQNGEDVRSTAFVRLTSRYVDAGKAKMGEILLPIDDKAFSFEPTPIPELVKSKEDLRQVMGRNGQKQMRPATEEEMAGMSLPPPQPGQPPQQPPMVPMTVADLAKQHLEKANDAAKKAEKRIFDWMIECQYPAEMRKVIFDAARIGVGVLKGPFPKKTKAQALQMLGDNTVSLQIVEEIKPALRWMDPWNAFPDPACGEDIQNGDHFIERDHLSPRGLRELKGQEGYIDSAIDKVLKEGPGKIYQDGRNPNEKPNEHRYEVWYYTGTLSREDMCAAQAVGAKELPEDMEDVFATITLVNDTVIRATLNPLESNEFPYHTVPWQRRAGHWVGVGVGEQIKMPQRMVNAGTRALLNNAGKSAGSQIVLDTSQIQPADGRWVITPDKIWRTVPSATTDDVRKSFSVFQFPNMTPQLMSVIEYAMRLAEEATSIPLVTQGQSGPTTPDTLGGMQLQNNNANQLLRDIGYSFDDHITEPVVRMMYEWLLLDENVPAEEKGDFKINAHGSIAMVERSIQDQTLAQMGGMVMNPAFGIDPKKWLTEMLKSKRLDPRTFEMSEEDAKKQQPQPPPQIAAAQIRAQADMERVKMQLQGDAQKTQMTLQAEQQIAAMQAKVETDIAARRVNTDTVYAETERLVAQDNAQARREELAIRRELAMLDYANKNQIKLDDVKARLAETSMKLRVQKELAAASGALDLHKHYNPPQVATPPVEPPGRAAPGHAFEA